MVMGRCLCVGSGGTLAQESDEIMVDNDIINNNDPHIAQMMITAIQLQRSTRTPNSTFESVRLNSVSSALGADVGFLADNSPGRSGTGGTPSGSGTGGDGHPDSDFKRDAKGNLVYSDELSGKYSSCDCLTLTSGYHDARDGTNFHGGIDLAPSRHDADALSVTSGTVVRIGANGFGDSAIIVRTPEGNWATYGHLESTSVRLNDPVNVGDKIGIMGNKGFSHGVHLHFQVTTGQMFGAGSQFLGVTGP